MRGTNPKKMIVSALVMLLLILEVKTAVKGIQEGIDLCLRTLIPSLFPFLIVSAMLTAWTVGSQLKPLRWICTLCRIPAGSESLFLAGLLGGYPVGAGNVAQAYRTGQLSKEDAGRMMVFCNNAGPAFLFGILGPQFSDRTTVWYLWAVHISSALLCGTLLPGETGEASKITGRNPITLTKAMEQAVKTMAQICGWVLLFRMVLEFLEGWLFWLIPDGLCVLISGFLELSNGCILLQGISDETMKFLLSSVMLAFGGICVWLQTVTVCSGIDCRRYLPGKLLQMLLSALLSLVVITVRGPVDPIWCSFGFVIVIAVFFLLKWCHLRKKEVAIC